MSREKPASESSGNVGNASSQGNPAQPFMQAYLNYQKALNEAATSKGLPASISEANKKYVERMQGLWPKPEVQQRVADAYRNFAMAWQASGPPDQVRKGITDAYDNYLQVLQSSMGSGSWQERAGEIQRSYIQDIRNAMATDAFSTQAEAAYREMIDAFKAAWAQVDASAVDAATLGMIGQAIQAAAQVTASASRWLAQQQMMIEANFPAAPVKS